MKYARLSKRKQTHLEMTSRLVCRCSTPMSLLPRSIKLEVCQCNLIWRSKKRNSLSRSPAGREQGTGDAQEDESPVSIPTAARESRRCLAQRQTRTFLVDTVSRQSVLTFKWPSGSTYKLMQTKQKTLRSVVRGRCSSEGAMQWR